VPHHGPRILRNSFRILPFAGGPFWRSFGDKGADRGVRSRLSGKVADSAIPISGNRRYETRQWRSQHDDP
jgi:hypothetical protein